MTRMLEVPHQVAASNTGPDGRLDAWRHPPQAWQQQDTVQTSVAERTNQSPSVSWICLSWTRCQEMCQDSFAPIQLPRRCVRIICPQDTMPLQSNTLPALANTSYSLLQTWPCGGASSKEPLLPSVRCRRPASNHLQSSETRLPQPSHNPVHSCSYPITQDILQASSLWSSSTGIASPDLVHWTISKQDIQLALRLHDWHSTFLLLIISKTLVSMASAPDTSVFVRIADLSAQALAQDGGVRTEEFLAACSEVLPIVGMQLFLSCSKGASQMPW